MTDFSSVLPSPPKAKGVLWIVDAKGMGGRLGFYAGLELRPGALSLVVARAAPIVKYMVGWTSAQVQMYATKRGWRLVKYG